MIDQPGLRFENLVACALLKWVQYREDTQAETIELRYFRDIDGLEVDFVIVENGQPVMLVECKWSDHEVSKSLQYMRKHFPA